MCLEAGCRPPVRTRLHECLGRATARQCGRDFIKFRGGYCPPCGRDVRVPAISWKAPRTIGLVPRQPHSRVAHIRFDIFKRLRVTFVAVAWWLKQEARTAHIGVPVVIHKVVKA